MAINDSAAARKFVEDTLARAMASGEWIAKTKAGTRVVPSTDGTVHRELTGARTLILRWEEEVRVA